MQTLKITDSTKAQSIATDIVDLIQSDQGLSVYAVGADAISEAISGIDLAKKLLKEEEIVLNIKPVLSEQKIEDDVTKTAITFQIITAPLFVEIARVTPTDEAVTQELN